MIISQFLLKTHYSESRGNSDRGTISFPKPEGYTFASSIRKFEVHNMTLNSQVNGIKRLFSNKSIDYNKINNDFLVDNYCLLNFMGPTDNHPSNYIDESAFNSVEGIQKKIEDYLNAPNDRKIQIYHATIYRFRSTLENFTGDFFISGASWWRVPTIHTGNQCYNISGSNIYIENGNIYYGKGVNFAPYPLLSLMVQDEYVDDFKVRSILNLPLDKSKFRYWIDSSVHNLRNEDLKGYKVFMRLLNYIFLDNEIKIEFKDNLSLNFINFPLPEINTISDRKLWLNSIKNGFMNKKYNKELPFNKMKIVKKAIQNPDILKLSERFYKRILEKQLENQYELIS